MKKSTELTLIAMYIIFICVMFLIMWSASGCTDDCIDSEKELSHYNTVEINGAVITEPVYQCPE